MELLKLKDLRLLVKTGAIIKNVKLDPVLIDEKKWYEISLVVKTIEGDEGALMITERNEKQLWRSLDKLIAFIESEIPVDEVAITINR